MIITPLGYQRHSGAYLASLCPLIRQFSVTLLRRGQRVIELALRKIILQVSLPTFRKGYLLTKTTTSLQNICRTSLCIRPRILSWQPPGFSLSSSPLLTSSHPPQQDNRAGHQSASRWHSCALHSLDLLTRRVRSTQKFLFAVSTCIWHLRRCLFKHSQNQIKLPQTRKRGEQRQHQALKGPESLYHLKPCWIFSADGENKQLYKWHCTVSQLHLRGLSLRLFLLLRSVFLALHHQCILQWQDKKDYTFHSPSCLYRLMPPFLEIIK